MVTPSALQKYSLFGGLMEDQIERLIPLMEQESYGSGDLVITEGELNDRIRFILSGRVEVSKGNLNLTEFGEGEFFGEMEVLDVMPAAAAIRALGPVELMSISNRALREIYKTDTKIFSMIIMNLARDLSRRLRRMDDRALEGG